jgi:hypothetical protein
MKFIYVDESGSRDHSDVFVMAGLLVDAYRLWKYTDVFDKLILDFLAKHPGTGSAKEIKTAALINGIGGWSKIDAAERKTLLKQICEHSSECASVYAVALSFSNFERALAPVAATRSATATGSPRPCTWRLWFRARCG